MRERSYLGSWGSQGSDNGSFDTPCGEAVDSNGYVYVVDTYNHRIQKYNDNGTFIAKWGSYGTGDGQFGYPTGVAVDSSGNVYVADTDNNRIQKFSDNGTFITKWGSSGTGDGQFSSPWGVAVDSSIDVYVADTSNNRIHKFDSSGNFTLKWGSRGVDDGQFSFPHGVAVDSDSYVYVADSYNHRIQKFQPPLYSSTYSTTTYTYDTLGNLTRVTDNHSNNNSMTYDWLSRKIGMTDPDMGSWSYSYDNNGNLKTQTDAKSNTITFTYDALNRLTGKSYSITDNITEATENVTYTYDSTTDNNSGKGRRTGMTDALGTTTYRYDARGRLIEERREVTGTDNFTTQFAYDGADRLTNIIYPTGENVTQTYNERGLPYSVSGTTAGDLVTSTLYNQLGQVTEINLGNTLRTTYGYYGTGGGYDTSGSYYGRLWEIKTLPQAGGTTLMNTRHTWDAVGNLESREDVKVSSTETFSYDFLDRLTSVSGAYSSSYTYNTIGNILSMNSDNYTYGTKPHAVTQVDSTSYEYDNNGNMVTRGSDSITWDAENRPVTISTANGTASFVYDGDGNRVKKIEGGEEVLYINKYYEKNLTTGNVTTHYYLGSRLVAMKKNDDLRYIHQDHLSGTALTTDTSGNQTGPITYYPYGSTRSGSVPTDKKFTGQRLDGTGLYYYGARYYDPVIGRFISADPIVQNSVNPQALNRYSYVLNNPLKYVDPTGLKVTIGGTDVSDLEAIINEIIEIENLTYEIPDYLWEELLELAKGWGEGEFDLWYAWEKLAGEEPRYTQHMEESEITFNVFDIDPLTQTVSFFADWDLISFDEPLQLRFVSGFQMAAIMYGATGLPLSPGGVSLYPGPIYIRTDVDRSTKSFTNLVAHESYHRWEQSLYVNSYWYDKYIGEAIRHPFAHDKRPSEIRAAKYANRYYRVY